MNANWDFHAVTLCDTAAAIKPESWVTEGKTMDNAEPGAVQILPSQS
jgi:hypothetical protein